MSNTPEPTFQPGDRVRHADADLRGTVERATGGNYVKVRWDHFGLAVAALGKMADLVPVADLVKLDA